jgi:hypothetical protein
MRDLHCRDFEFKDAAAAGAGLLIGAGIGAGLMYLFDPDRGRSRRSRLEAQAGSLYRRAEGKVHKLAQDVANRAEGVAAEAKHLLDHDPVDAPKLVARVNGPGSLEIENREGDPQTPRCGSPRKRRGYGDSQRRGRRA